MIGVFVGFSCIPLNAELNPTCHLLALLGGATIVVISRLSVKQLHTLPVLHFNHCLTAEYSETTAHLTATSILATKSTHRSLSAQRLSERTVFSTFLPIFTVLIPRTM